jgi:hypothetical protein
MSFIESTRGSRGRAQQDHDLSGKPLASLGDEEATCRVVFQLPRVDPRIRRLRAKKAVVVIIREGLLVVVCMAEYAIRFVFFPLRRLAWD